MNLGCNLKETVPMDDCKDKSAMRASGSPILLAELSATSKAFFIDRMMKEHDIRDSNRAFVNANRIRLRSHISVDFGIVIGWVKIKHLSSGDER